MKKLPLPVKWLLAISPATAALLMYLILPHFPEFTEYVISRGLFRVAVFPLEWVMSLIPFSVTEAAVLLGIPALLIAGAVWLVRIICSENRKRTLEKGCRFVCFCLSAALLIFVVNDGANFSRLSVNELLQLPNQSYSAEQLYAVTADLASRASTAREALPEDENGCTQLSVKRSELLKNADDCYGNISKEYPFLKTAVRRVKSVRLSHLWSYTGYTGVYCPWLGEASINTDVPECDFGHTAAHEIAHTMGFAKENECNFLAWLACSTSDMPDYEYSGHLQMYIYCSNALYKADRELWRKAAENLSDGVRRDLKQRNEYWDEFEGEVMESSQEFNDSFIKANGVESGILSYDEAVALMLGYYDKSGWLQ